MRDFPSIPSFLATAAAPDKMSLSQSATRKEEQGRAKNSAEEEQLPTQWSRKVLAHCVTTPSHAEKKTAKANATAGHGYGIWIWAMGYALQGR